MALGAMIRSPMRLGVFLASLCLLGGALGGCPDGNQATVDRHNALRARHPGTPTVSWDNNLESGSQSYAQTLASNACNLVHSGGNFGENLAAQYGAISAACVDSTQWWYDEISQYQWTSTPWTSNQANFHNIGHFTQVVWASSLQIGCGYATGTAYGNPCMVVVCRYYPAGNIADDQYFQNNVLTLGTSSSSPPPPSPSPLPPSPPNGQSSSPPLPPTPSPSSPPSPTPDGAGCPEGFGPPWTQHNLFRQNNQAPGLAWDNQLALAAQGWSQYLASYNNCTLLSSIRSQGMGENLAAGPQLTCQGAVAQWYAQNTAYPWSSSTPYSTSINQGLNVANFAQVVWKNTMSVGCGWASGVYNNGTSCAVVTCWYMTGIVSTNAQYRANVLPPIAPKPPSISSPPSPPPSRSPPPLMPIGGYVCQDSAMTTIYHNAYRLKHSAAFVSWSNSLAVDAANWAGRLAGVGCALIYDIGTTAGQNIARSIGSSQDCSAYVPDWYNEIVNYNFTITPKTDNPNMYLVRDFTQIVWQATMEVGCGWAQGTYTDGLSSCQILVCRYNPRGNAGDNNAYLYNVLPASSKKIL